MKVKPTEIDVVYEIENNVFEDYRGQFVKPFNENVFKEHSLEVDFKENFYSISRRNVLRGMHYQLPPMDHDKLVYVVEGEILDVVVDVRKSSPTFGQSVAVQLNVTNGRSIYIGKGCAHGFLTLSEQAIVIYMTSSVHSPSHDTGIHWNSFGFDWGTNKPIVSVRDESLSAL